MLIAEKVQGLSDVWNIIAPNGILGIHQLPEVIDNNGYQLEPQASAFPGSLGMSAYGPYQGTQPAGGTFFDDLDNYEPLTITDPRAARAQVKRLANQSIELVKILNRNVSSVVGRGLRLKPTPNHEILGITLEEATAWGKTVGNAYHLWSKSKDSDITGINNKYQNQRFAWRQRKLLGEAFPRYFYSDDPNLMNPLQIGFIDPNQIRGDELIFSTGPESQDDGLIKDKNGKVTAYKVWITDPQNPGSFKDITVQAKDTDTGLPIMGHMYEPKHAGQTRGVTEFFPAISDLEKIRSWKTAASDRAKNGASRDYVIENKQSDPSDMDINTANPTSAGTDVKVDSLNGTPTPIPSLPWTYNTIKGGQMQTGIVISGGRQGDELKASPDLSPGETTKDFIGFMSDSVAATINMAPERVDMKVNTSFTAAMGAAELQNIESRIERDDLESDSEDNIYFAWLTGEIAAGRTQAPGFSDPIMRAAWLQKRLTSDPKIVLNPVQEATAAEKNVAMGSIDLAERAENFNGSDYETNVANLKKQIEILPTNSPIIKPPEVEKEIEDDTDKLDKGEN